MWTVDVVGPDRLPDLMAVPSRFIVTSRIMFGWLTEVGEEMVEQPYEKDYDAFVGDRLTDLPQAFDVSRWGVFLLCDKEGRVGGGAVVAVGGYPMLAGRTNLGQVVDIRVDASLQGQGLGRMLWAAITDWSRASGLAALQVETQDVNVAACRFYRAMGGRVVRVDPRAYPHEMNETLVLWSFDLNPASAAQ